MKKIFLAIMAVAAITFTACNGTAKGGAETDSINVDSVPTPPEANVDAMISSLSTALAENNVEGTQYYLAKAQAYIAKLQEEGKLEEVTVYVSQLQRYIIEHEEQINNIASGNETIAGLVATVKAIPTDAAALAKATEADTKATVEATKQKVNETVEAAKETAKQKANETVEAAKETAKKKANEAIDKATEDAKNAVKNQLGL